jgi:hypothetical protein
MSTKASRLESQAGTSVGLNLNVESYLGMFFDSSRSQCSELKYD